MNDSPSADENPEAEPASNEAATTGTRGPRIREISFRLMVPNAITVLAICAGLSGIRMAFENRFEMAVGLVLIAAFLDGIDGRVARLLKSQSKFGAQMDSLADIVNFGVAPALVLYAFMLDQARSAGWIAAMLYAICAALRLARFNVMSENPVQPKWSSEYFVGVPAPAGALLVLLPIYLGFLGVPPTKFVAYGASLYTVLIGYLLISRVPVWSGKSAGKSIRRDLMLPILLVIAIYAALLTSYTWEVLTLTAVAYLATLPFGALKWRREYGTAEPDVDDILGTSDS